MTQKAVFGSGSQSNVQMSQSSSRGVLPQAKVKTVKMALVIVIGELEIEVKM